MRFTDYITEKEEGARQLAARLLKKMGAKRAADEIMRMKKTGQPRTREWDAFYDKALDYIIKTEGEYLKEYVSSADDSGIGGNSEACWGKRGAKVFLYVRPVLYWYDSGKDMVYKNGKALEWMKGNEAYWDELKLKFRWAHNYEKRDILNGEMTHYQLYDIACLLSKKKILPNSRVIYKEYDCVKGRVFGQMIYIDGFRAVYDDPTDKKGKLLGDKALDAIYKYLL